jgi:hypothetical protein
MNSSGSEWQRKGATLSDKTAGKEFGLKEEEIYQAIREGRLQYREGAMHGNPYLRLLRREVEVLVCEKYGRKYMENRRAKKELASIHRELKKLKARVKELEARKMQLTEGLAP